MPSTVICPALALAIVVSEAWPNSIVPPLTKPSAAVIFPAEMSARSYPVPLVFTVVPGSACKLSKKVNGSPVALTSLNIPAYFAVPPTPY